jgi:hypothetical protein
LRPKSLPLILDLIEDGPVPMLSDDEVVRFPKATAGILQA